jgi:hypothetical protein
MCFREPTYHQLLVTYVYSYINSDILTYVRIKRFQWAGRVVRFFDIRVPQRNLEVSKAKGLLETDEWVGR